MGQSALAGFDKVSNRVLQSTVTLKASPLAEPKAVGVKMDNLFDREEPAGAIVARVIAVVFQAAKDGCTRTPESVAKLRQGKNSGSKEGLHNGNWLLWSAHDLVFLSGMTRTMELNMLVLII